MVFKWRRRYLKIEYSIRLSGYVLCKDNHKMTQQFQQELILTYFCGIFVIIFPQKMAELAHKASMIDVSRLKENPCHFVGMSQTNICAKAQVQTTIQF